MTIPDWLSQNKVTVPVGACGAARIERYTITEEKAEGINWKRVFNEDDRALSYPGEYTGLVLCDAFPDFPQKSKRLGGLMVMSDEASEIADHLPFIEMAMGKVLITGLGIGVCLQALLRKPDIEHVTVVEKSSDVLALVAAHYLAMFGGERITFVNSDAFAWLPPKGAFFDFAWHDIWPLAMGAYWREHVTLLHRYGIVARHQESWRGEWMRRAWQAEGLVQP